MRHNRTGIENGAWPRVRYGEPCPECNCRAQLGDGRCVHCAALAAAEIKASRPGRRPVAISPDSPPASILELPLTLDRILGVCSWLGCLQDDIRVIVARESWPWFGDWLEESQLFRHACQMAARRLNVNLGAIEPMALRGLQDVVQRATRRPRRKPGKASS